MEIDLEELVREVVETLEIDVPVYGAQVVGDCLELRLYGGRLVVWSIPGRAEVAVVERRPGLQKMAIPAGDLATLKVEQLKELARIWGAPRWNRLRKAELVAALEEIRSCQPV